MRGLRALAFFDSAPHFMCENILEITAKGLNLHSILEIKNKKI